MTAAVYLFGHSELINHKKQKNMKKLNSIRLYQISISEVTAAEIPSICTSTHDILDIIDHNDDLEWKYAVADILDDVLDLKNGESMYFQPNRDDKRSKGIILRVK